MCSQYQGYPFEVISEGTIEVDLEETDKDQEPTQAEKEEAVREFAEWAHTEGAAFIDLEAVDQDVAEAEVSGDWDVVFYSAALAVQQIDEFLNDPTAIILAALAEAQREFSFAEAS